MTGEGLEKATSQRVVANPPKPATIPYGSAHSRLRDRRARSRTVARANQRRETRSLFKLDTWPRLRGREGWDGQSFVCAPAFENQNQIHYSRLDRPAGSSYCWPLSAWKRSCDFIGWLTIVAAIVVLQLTLF